MMSDNRLSHLDNRGRAHMIDVGQKTPTRRRATASRADCDVGGGIFVVAR